MSGTVELKIRLEAELARHGDDWVASCLLLDICTQAESRESAIRALHEAIYAWFESCLERRVLAKALEEVGFQLAKPGDLFPVNAGTGEVRVRELSESHEILEFSVPAYIAAQHDDCPSYASR